MGGTIPKMVPPPLFSSVPARYGKRHFEIVTFVTVTKYPCDIIMAERGFNLAGRFVYGWLAERVSMKKELVRDWMSTEVVTIPPDMTLPEAHKLMVEEEIRRLPVVDHENRLIGIVTLGDVRSAEPSPATSLSIWEMNYLLAALKIEKVMTWHPKTIRPEATLAEAARMMLENRISGLPVVDDENHVVGILTESDIFSMVVLHEWSAEHLDD